MTPTIVLTLAFAAVANGYTPMPATPSSAHAAAARMTRLTRRRRAPAPAANFFEQLGKVADYNKKYFATALSSMFDDRTATASHVLFGFQKYENAAEDAAALKEKIESGEISFADAAKQYSTCPSSAKGGDLGNFKKGAMVPEFDEVAFDPAVELGSTSLVKTQFGVHLVQVYQRDESK